MKNLLNGAIIAGIIINIIGLYYMIIEAGIPYQDAPLELQLEYSINMNLGGTLAILGIMLFGFGLISRIIVSFLERNSNKSTKVI